METYYYDHQSVLTVLRSRCACSTHFALTFDLTYDLDFQSAASCGRDPYTYKNIKVQRLVGSKDRVETHRRTGHDRMHYLTR